MEEQQPNANTESNFEPPVVKDPEPTVVKAGGSNKAIFIVLSFFIISTIGLVAIVAYLLFFSAKKQDDTIVPEVSITPSAEPELTPSPEPESNILYYIEEAKVYKRDLVTKQSELLPLGEVQLGGESSLAGTTYPVISKDKTKLAYIPEVDKVSIYDIQADSTISVTLPQPTIGEIEVFISGFNSNSSKLLIHLGCITPADEIPEGFEYCTEEFVAQKTGLYVYDLNTNIASKVTTQNNEWESYDSLIGWVNYDEDKFVVTKDEYRENSLYQTQVFEIDTSTNRHALLSSGNGDMEWFIVWDFDEQGKMLYQQYDGSKWELYLDDELIAEETGFTSMQFPYFYNNGSDRITYYSNTQTTVNFKIVDLDGNLLGSKNESYDEASPISYKIMDQYLLENYFNEKVNIYDISHPSSFTLIDTIEGRVNIIVKKG